VVLVSFWTHSPATCASIDSDDSVHHWGFHHLRRYSC
jgi:hypothetical protein